MLEGTVGRVVGFFRRQKKPYRVNMAKNVVQNFSLGLTQQYQSIYISELGAGPLELGYVSGIGGVAATLVTVPAGWMADRYGIRRMLLVAIALNVVGYSIFGLAGSWQETILAYSVATVAMCVGLVVCPMICGSTLKNEERVTGMQLCDTVAAIPRIVAPIVAAYFITRLGGISVEGIRPLFWLEAVGLIMAFAIIYLRFEDPRAGASIETLNPLAGLTRVFDEGMMVKRWLLYRMVSSLPRYMAFFVPLYARELKGAGSYTLGLMDTGYWLLVVLLALPIGMSADRFGRKRLIALMTPVYSASLLVLVHAPNDTALILSGALSAFLMLISVTQGAINAELVPREIHGSWFGLNGLCRGVVNIASPVLGGLIWEYLGPDYVFYFLALSQLVNLLILATMPESATRG
jgi:MFS family permease